MYPGLPRATVTAPSAARYTAAPPSGAVTNTAPTTRLAFALAQARVPPPTPRLWGSLPLEEIEGHEPDPAYDVRPIEGLGRAPVRAEELARLAAARAGLGFVIPAAYATGGGSSQAPLAEETPAPGLFGISTPYLVLAGVAAVALGMILKR